jgi:hypothetical protein
MKIRGRRSPFDVKLLRLSLRIEAEPRTIFKRGKRNFFYIDKTASAKIPRGRTVGQRTKQPRRCSIKTRSGDRPLDRQNKAVAARWGFFNQNTIANAIRLRAALNSNASR